MVSSVLVCWPCCSASTRDPRPVFRQIVDEVQRCVAVGVLKPGEPLPAVRTLAAELRVNAEHRAARLPDARAGRHWSRCGVGSGRSSRRRCKAGIHRRQAGDVAGRSPSGCCARPTGTACCERPHGGAEGDRAAARRGEAQVRAVRNRYEATDATRMLGAQPASTGGSSPALPTATNALITIQ